MFKEVLGLDALKLGIFLLYFLFAIVIALYNWLYLAKTLQSNKDVGLHPPPGIELLVKLSTWLVLLTVSFIIIIFLLRAY